jgi:1,4-alpha-glucan branching enzyme
MPTKSVKAKSVEFKLHAPRAKKVSIAGSFNNWDSKTHPAKKDTRGYWVTELSLKPGRHEYKFVVDGNWITDPKCANTVWNSVGSQNCILEVR